MAKIKVTAEIEFDKNIWYNEKYNDEYEWFLSMLDNDNTILILHNNEVGDSIAVTNNFRFKIIE